MHLNKEIEASLEYFREHPCDQLIYRFFEFDGFQDILPEIEQLHNVRIYDCDAEVLNDLVVQLTENLPLIAFNDNPSPSISRKYLAIYCLGE